MNCASSIIRNHTGHFAGRERCHSFVEKNKKCVLQHLTTSSVQPFRTLSAGNHDADIHNHPFYRALKLGLPIPPLSMLWHLYWREGRGRSTPTLYRTGACEYPHLISSFGIFQSLSNASANFQSEILWSDNEMFPCEDGTISLF